MVEIRPERAGEAAAIEEVHRLAFGSDTEARLVRRLRAEGYTIVSITAVDGAEIVGHVYFSRVAIAGLEAVSLAPVSVLPERQRQGIGSALIRAGLDACRSSAVDAALVVGEPGYYTRFGFSLAVGSLFRSPWPPDYLLAIELQPGVLSSPVYDVEYPAAFQEV